MPTFSEGPRLKGWSFSGKGRAFIQEVAVYNDHERRLSVLERVLIQDRKDWRETRREIAKIWNQILRIEHRMDRREARFDAWIRILHRGAQQ
jgi:hypothetical protein